MKLIKIKKVLLSGVMVMAILGACYAQTADTAVNKNTGFGGPPQGTMGNNQGTQGTNTRGETTRNTFGSARQINNAGAPGKYQNGDYGPTGNAGPSGTAGSLPPNGPKTGPNGTHNPGQGVTPGSGPTGR